MQDLYNSVIVNCYLFNLKYQLLHYPILACSVLTNLYFTVFCRRPDEAENMPISIDLQNIRHKREENLQLIRTNPPSPQCFSATRGPNKTTPSKASKSRLMVCN